MKKYIVLLIGLLLILNGILLADPTNAAGPIVPAGFNFWYIPIFCLGMIAHWFFHFAKNGGGKFSLANITMVNFTAWFFNKFHMTLITGAAAAVLGVASSYGLDIGFAVINAIGVSVAVAAGYIADSAFNQGATPAS